MTLHLNIAQLAVENFHFVYSPFHEMLLSLHTLHDYKHHTLHISWALERRNLLAPELKRLLHVYGVIFEKLMGLSWEPLYHSEMDNIDASFSIFEQMTDEEFAEPLVTGLVLSSRPSRDFLREKHSLHTLKSDHDLQEHIRHWIQDRYPLSEPLLDMLLRDVQYLKNELTSFLIRYWQSSFQFDWHHQEAYFRQEIQRVGQIMFENGPDVVFTALGRDFRQEKHNVVIMNKPDNSLVYTLEDEIWLFPSVFSWPHIIFSHSEEQYKTSMIIYAIPHIQHGAMPPLTPEKLLIVLRATADKTRLQILKLLKEKSRSNKELADILHISEAAVSKHLIQLRNSGWVESQRKSYYVMYSIKEDNLESLYHGLKSYLTERY
jgi:DNA-binding transcriptional ArsR family regulator